MIQWIHSPADNTVAHVVDRYWFLLKEHDSDNGVAYPELFPDTAAHLIIAPKKQDYEYACEAITAKGTGSHWLFPHHHTYQMDHSKPLVIVGVKFKVGALYSLNLPIKQTVVDQVCAVNLQELLNNVAVDETEILEKAKDASEACCAALDKMLLPWIRQGDEDKHAKLTRRALALFNDEPISNLGEALNCSQRTLERSFNRVTGLTLKQCKSINRLEVMLEHLYQKNAKEIDWADVAYEFGFSDQPHLIRYLKSSIGVTPGEYAKQRNLTIDIYGGVGMS
ncbi:MAG: helix-turn-helix domain-containing protein [Sneathiella sp.]